MLAYRTLINSTVWTLSNAAFQIRDLINEGYEDVSLAQGQSRIRGFRLRSTASSRYIFATERNTPSEFAFLADNFRIVEFQHRNNKQKSFLPAVIHNRDILGARDLFPFRLTLF